MIHQSEIQPGDPIISARTLAKDAGLHISLALPCPQEDITVAALSDHFQGDLVVLVDKPSEIYDWLQEIKAYYETDLFSVLYDLIRTERENERDEF